MTFALWMTLSGLVGCGTTDVEEQFHPAVRLEAGGQSIDTEIGHAAPFVCDWDGDGKRDLLVGQFGGGVLWIYRNLGSNADPKLTEGFKFKGGREDGCVPTG
jgi:hypothetical protein